MAREIQVELRITGLAILDARSLLIHFIDTSHVHCEEHRHHPRITFRPDDYVGLRIPGVGQEDLFRPETGADFHTSFPLQGQVTVGTRNEIRSGRVIRPRIGTQPPAGLFRLEEIVKRSQLGYTKLVDDYVTKASTSIRLIGGEFFAGKRIVNKRGKEQLFEPLGEPPLYLCDHIIWRRDLNRSLRVQCPSQTYLLGRRGEFGFSMTNLPNHGWLGGPVDRRYFRHLGMLGSLGVAEGDFKPPSPSGGSTTPGSESCSPLWGP